MVINFRHFIPHVNRADLTARALNATVGTIAEDRTIILDNSPNAAIAGECDLWGVDVFVPTVPLTTAQTMNWMRAIAIEGQLDCFGFQHNDGEPEAVTIDGLYKLAAEMTEPWGVLFSNYDVCCVFNTEAVQVVGEWDWLRFPFYHLDNDYYHRLRVAGFPTINTGLKCLHHNDASNTIKSNAERRLVNEFYFPVSGQLLQQKWGHAV